MDDQARTMKAVWTMVERPQQNGSGPKSHWTRVGVGFVNRDGSITLKLDALPVNGTLQVREWEPYERRQDGQDAQRHQDGQGSAPRQRPRPLPAMPPNDSLL